MEELVLIKELQLQIALYEDMKAYKQLYELLYSRLFNFCHSFVKSPEAAEEIVSDVFIKLWSIRTSVAEINNLKVYLYTIAKNFSINYVTKHNKLRTVNIDDVQFEVFQGTADPEQKFISSEIATRVNNAINSLPHQCRIIFTLVKEGDLKYKEVASILNISVNTVRNQVAIATKKISDELPLSLKKEFTSVSKFSDS